ncbi:MAG TPA: shikimate dehydrogenase [Candidatus Xenobia bacterium]|nr:shikimate dehydrogenase [Candidatus Xenobia bacterium]
MAGRSFPDRIAVVVAETTLTGFLARLRRVERRARLLELRLDALGSMGEVLRLLERIARRPLRALWIATCRSRSQGGGFDAGPSAQLAILALAARAGCSWIDVEAETLERFPSNLRSALLPPVPRIVSHHDFERTPPLEALYRRLARLGADWVKIAITPCTQGDNVKLLVMTRRHRRRVISVGMGTRGLPGRVLAVVAGSALTYAAPEGARASAPAQPTVNELRELYRADRLNARTRVYGLLGNPVAHSFSPAMHNAAFQHARMNAVYLPLEASTPGELLDCLEPFCIAGLSVTHPHKEAILRYLDAVDPLAATIGAVNTVVVRGGGKLYGYNTDYVGVLRTLQHHVLLEGARVLLVGAGGAARACAFALATAGAFISVTARRPGAARALARAVGGEAIPRPAVRKRRFDATINCTPVGQAPDADASPLRAEELNSRVVFDLVYNPLETKLLRLARRRGIRTVPGWQMLVEQGAAQFEIWTGLRAPLDVMRRAVLRGLKQNG